MAEWILIYRSKVSKATLFDGQFNLFVVYYCSTAGAKLYLGGAIKYRCYPKLFIKAIIEKGVLGSYSFKSVDRGTVSFGTVTFE